MNRFQQNRIALGSEVMLTVVSDEINKEQIFKDLWQTIDKFEARFSRFKESSELTKFNKLAGNKTLISKEFKNLLISAKEWGLKTDGLYNPLILPTLQSVGYIGSWPTPQKYNKNIDYRERKIHLVEEIIIGTDWAMIPKNSALDFGGCGKGYLLDLLALDLDNLNISNYWLSIGGDIICNGQDVTGNNWEIGVASALEENEIVDKFINTNGKKFAIATSGRTKRKGVNDDKSWHHIIDPRTNSSAETDILTASIESNSALEADILAKCLLILGSSNAMSFTSKMKISKVVIQTFSESEVKIERYGK